MLSSALLRGWSWRGLHVKLLLCVFLMFIFIGTCVKRNSTKFSRFVEHNLIFCMKSIELCVIRIFQWGIVVFVLEREVICRMSGCISCTSGSVWHRQSIWERCLVCVLLIVCIALVGKNLLILMLICFYWVCCFSSLDSWFVRLYYSWIFVKLFICFVRRKIFHLFL